VILNQLCYETMRLESLTKIIQPITVTGADDLDIKGISYDSRQVRPGHLFVCLHGRQHDGTDFIDEVIEKGAVAVVSESADWSREGVSHVHVEDARRALAEIACAFYGEPSSRLDVIGITGTNGKTTAAFMAKAILKVAGREPGLLGTVRYEIGERLIPAGRTTPEAPELQAMLDQMVKAGCRSAVMEVSSHALDQKRVWGIDFDVGVFTNLTQDHLDYHGNMEDYFAAKTRLFRGLGQMEKAAVAAINIDDPWGMRLATINGFRTEALCFGTHPRAAVRAEDVEVNARGSSFQLRSPWGDTRVQLRLLGRFNVSNALAAMAACGALGIKPALMAEVLGELQSVPGRMEVIPNRRGLHVFVDYAHTDDALKNVLSTVREIVGGRIILVFGCGGNRDRTKRALMGAVAERLADHSIVTSDNPRNEDPADIANDVVEGFAERDSFQIILDREEAIARALTIAEEGDVVLVAGKGHENYQEFHNTVVPFDDREVVRGLLS